MNQGFLDLIFYWILPCSLSFGAFLLFKQLNHSAFERLDTDRVWKVLLRIGIALGVLAIAYVLIVQSEWFKTMSAYAEQGFNRIAETSFADKIVDWGRQVLVFFMDWVPVYVRAFVIVWIISGIVMIQSLIWRINFFRGFNIFFQTFILYPFLLFKYFLGYQTPFFDFIQSKLFVAKIKENLNDSYFDSLQGVDEKGEKFDSGVGGTVQTQKIKKVAIAVRMTRAKIRTAGGIRHAELMTDISREQDSKELIEKSLAGLGQRLTAQSIRFQDDPVFTPEKQKLVFDSDVKYNAGDALGSFRGIFENPFAKDRRITNNGDGAISATKTVFLNFFKYIIHFTPTAVYDQIVARATLLFTRDDPTSKAKFVAQQNLDLSVVPEPLDPDTGNNVEQQKELALKSAQARQEDVKNALDAVGLGGAFDKVVVGGNTAIYYYTLPRSAKLPTDFDRIQNSISLILKTNDIPIISVSAGVLSISMVNGVNVPVDFRKMIEDRPKGLTEVISGIAGVDALGKPIEFKLGDKVPHAMLFGKTGTGKTVTIMTILYSIMSAVDPTMLKIITIDGKGNSFEFLRTDNSDSPSYHPNPFMYSQPADASGDIEYARALIKHVEKETRRRVELFKQAGVSKIAEWNRKFPEEKLYELLVVVDEFSAITDQDKLLDFKERATNSTEDTFEYIAKMGRSLGIRLLLANQTARKEKVPGKISANLPGRISLGVSEPIESEIALPESKIALHLIDQAGEFYSTMNGIRNPEHGNTPYLPDDVMYALNDSLESKFGHHDYVMTRDQVMAEANGEEVVPGKIEENYPIPDPAPTVDTQIKKLVETIDNYPEWAVANKRSVVFAKNKFVGMGTPKEVQEHQKQVREALKMAEQKVDQKRLDKSTVTRSDINPKKEVKTIVKGKTGSVI